MTASEVLIERLGIVEENILQEAALQPQRFVDAAKYRVAKMRKVSAASAAVDYKKSKLALQIRANKDAEGTKPTEGYIRERIEASQHIVALRVELEKAYAEEEFAKLLLEAYRMRRDAIRVMADYQNMQGMSEMREVDRAESRRKMLKAATELHKRRKKLDEGE